MRRECTGEDETLVTAEGKPCACGKTFDDVENSVIWPHARLLTREEKDELFRDLGLEWHK